MTLFTGPWWLVPSFWCAGAIAALVIVPLYRIDQREACKQGDYEGLRRAKQWGYWAVASVYLFLSMPYWKPGDHAFEKIVWVGGAILFAVRATNTKALGGIKETMDSVRAKAGLPPLKDGYPNGPGSVASEQRKVEEAVADLCKRINELESEVKRLSGQPNNTKLSDGGGGGNE